MADHTLVSLPAHITALTGFEALRVGARKVWAYPKLMNQSTYASLSLKELKPLSHESMAFRLSREPLINK